MQAQQETYEFDIIIIGAGVVGLAIAHELSNQYEKILLIEKESTFGRHISSRNSEVIHSGIYYEPNSLKAKLCSNGNKLIYDFVKKYQIDHQNCGKIIIASEKNDEAKLESLMQNGQLNGVQDMRLLTAKEVHRREPLIHSSGGLWIPASGIIDSHQMMKTLEYLIIRKENTVIYNTKVININHSSDQYTIFFQDMDYQAKSSVLINAAGLWCCKIASMIGIDDYDLHFCKGEYYKTSKYRNKVHSLIYPIPTEISLGIHIVLHLDGTLGFGPNAYYINDIDYSMDGSHKQEFLKHINTYMDLNEVDLAEDFTGIRPKIQQEGEPSHDFIIKNESNKGYNNFINLIGIESPGLTASLAIAKYVKGIIC